MEVTISSAGAANFAAAHSAGKETIRSRPFLQATDDNLSDTPHVGGAPRMLFSISPSGGIAELSFNSPWECLRLKEWCGRRMER